MQGITGGKRQRPRSATMITFMLILCWAAPATSSTSSSSKRAHKNIISSVKRHSSVTETRQSSAWSRLLKDTLTTIPVKRRSLHDNNKPHTIQLGNEYDNHDAAAIRKRRRAQVYNYRFTVDSPHPTFVPPPTSSSVSSSSPTVSPSIARHVSTAAPSTNNDMDQDGRASGDQVPTVAVGVVSAAEGETVVRPPINIPVISKSTKAPSAPFQPLKFAAVPVGFDVLLETDSQQDLEEMALQAKQILEDHLYKAFDQGFSDEEGVVVRSVDLNVQAMPTVTAPPSTATDPPQRRHRVLFQSLQRFLQSQLLSRAITLESRGVAGFQVNRDAVDTQEFLNEVNTIINDSVQPQALMDLFQNDTSGLSDYRVSSVTNTGTAPQDTKDDNGPTMWEIIIALVLIVVVAASLVAYVCIFLKKRKKRNMRRKQFGVSSKMPSPYKGPPPVSTRGRPHGASVTPAAAAFAASSSGMHMNNMPPVTPGGQGIYPMGGGRGDMNHSSSSESSYKGLGSEPDDDGADIFAKELRLAASLDRRAWNDFQHRKEQLTDENDDIYQNDYNRDMEANPSSGVYRDLSGMEAGVTAMDNYGLEEELPSPPGAVGLTVTGDTVSIQSNSSFPYGDEQDTAGYLPRKMYGDGAKTGILQDQEAETYMTSVGKVERDDSSGGWRTTQKAESDLSPGRGTPKYSFLYHSQEPNADTEPDAPDYPPGSMDERNGMLARHSAEIASSGAVRGSPMSQSWSTNQLAGSTGNGTTSALRGSPHSSSLNSASRGISSGTSPAASPAFDSAGAVNPEMLSAGVSEEESMMETGDIVEEVQRLSQFVKSYEQKKENRYRRDAQREERMDASNSISSSVDYDSLMETVNSLQKAVEAHPPVLLGSESKINTSSTPNGPNSPQRSRDRGIPRIESMPSSDSSDIETVESDRRLGITPFSVQKPAGYQNPAMLHSPIAGLSNNTGALYEASPSPDYSENEDSEEDSTTFKEITPMFQNAVSSQSSDLASLRHSDAILDGSITDGVGPSDEFSIRESQVRQVNGKDLASPALRDPRSIPPRQRSKNRGFNNIVNMFEAKVKDPIYPPNESWQYNY